MSIEERVAKLEQAVASFHRGANEVRASRVVIARHGAVENVGCIEVAEQGVRLTLGNEQAPWPRVQLDVQPDLAMLCLFGEANRPRMVLSTDALGQPRLTLTDSRGTNRAMLGFHNDEPVLVFFDEDGKPAWAAP